MKVTKKSILENHKIYTYEYTNIDDALAKMAIFRRYKRLISKNHPYFKFNIDLSVTPDNQTLTVEVWTFPKLLEN